VPGVDNLLRIDTLYHEGLASRKVMRFSHRTFRQQNMPQTAHNKVQFGLNRRAMSVKEGMMSMIEDSLHSPIKDKCDKCSLDLLPHDDCNYRVTG
jgi:hypothetical protein